jgi:hypothetical protein
MSNLIDIIDRAWGWIGLKPHALADLNAFGNALVLDNEDRYWRICPEELSCRIVAADRESFLRLRADASFIADWEMDRLRGVAQNKFGDLPEGRCYCLVIPAVLGGEYSVANVETISLAELLSAAGSMALQIKDLPDGAKVRLRVLD